MPPSIAGDHADAIDALADKLTEPNSTLARATWRALGLYLEE